MEKGYVLYVDHAQHPAPLSMCYHATGARRLSSAVMRHPPATLTEVDSAFCPQCLSYHDASSAGRIGFCPKPSCARCPLCQAVCSIDLEDNLFFYRCGACNWTSKECNLVVQLEGGQDVGRLELARALEDLGVALKRRRASDDTWQDPWKKLLHAWDKRTQEDKGSMVQRDNRQLRDNLEGWSIETLEASMQQRRRALQEEESIAKLHWSINRVSLEDDPVSLDESMNSVSCAAIQLQTLNRPDQMFSRSEMLPLPIPLRPRNSRRCRAELAHGRPGILLKPKLNPLEGDSSLRSGHGQWFKKDSSAILVMPRVCVVDFDATAEHTALLIKVTNPTLGPMRLRFASSSYQGEYSWDIGSEQRETCLNQILVDELNQEFLNIHLQTDVLADLATTETVQLLSAEDSFIEFGGKARETPTEVRNWKASNEKVEKSAMRMVASSSSTAWFEIITFGMESVSGRQPAIPLAVEVEVGNGSWESSLITQQKADSDFVAFDIVIAFHKVV